VQKKLLAAAVISAFAAPVAFAQPANVTIYGNLSMDVFTVSGSGATAGSGNDYQRRTVVGSPGTNWIGFRGQESLGGGLRAVWQVENGLGGVDGTGTSTWGSRNTFVGLAGGFGQVHFGLFDSPYKRVMGVNNRMMFGLTGPSGMNAILNNGDTSGGTSTAYSGSTAFSRRTANSINYHSPSFGGFSVEAQYGANEYRSVTSGGAQSDPYVMSASLRYSSGPIAAGLGYQKQNDLRGSNLADDSWILSASYTSGPFLIQGAYTTLSYGTATGDLTRNNFLIGGQYSTGPHRFRLQYQVAQDTKGAVGTNANTTIGGVRVATAANGLGADTGANVLSLNYGHALSKRTEVYGFYSKLNNERNAVVNMAGTGALQAGGMSAGLDVTYIGVGMNHSF